MLFRRVVRCGEDQESKQSRTFICVEWSHMKLRTSAANEVSIDIEVTFQVTVTHTCQRRKELTQLEKWSGAKMASRNLQIKNGFEKNALFCDAN